MVSSNGAKVRITNCVIYFNLLAQGVIYLITIYKKSERNTINVNDIKKVLL